MSVLTSQLQPGSEEFQHNQAAMQAAVAELGRRTGARLRA